MRHFLLVIAGLLSLLTVVLLAGFLSTNLLIRDNVNQYDGKERDAARGALLIYHSAGCTDLQDSITRYKLQIVDLELNDQQCPINEETPDYQASIQAYTLFGIPTDRGVVSCSQVNCAGTDLSD